MPFHRTGLTPWLSLAVITTLLLIPVPGTERYPALSDALLNACHSPAFAWLAHVAFVALRSRYARPSRRPYALVLAGAASYGALIEVVQSFVGRSASSLDFLNDLVGVAFALLLHARAERGPGRSSWLTAAAAFCMVLALLPLSMTLAAYVQRATNAPVLWRNATPAFLQFALWQRGGAPGLFLHEVLLDWRAYDHLEIDIENPLPQELQVVVRLNDRFHDYKGPDRWARPYRLGPQSRATLRIPLAQIRTQAIAREIQLGDMRGLMILGGTRGQLPPFTVHEIRLAKAP